MRAKKSWKFSREQKESSVTRVKFNKEKEKRTGNNCTEIGSFSR